MLKEAYAFLTISDASLVPASINFLSNKLISRVEIGGREHDSITKNPVRFKMFSSFFILNIWSRKRKYSLCKIH